MNRFRKRSFFRDLPPMRSIGLLVLMGFVVFVSFRIFTVPTRTVQVLSSPDGRQKARLQHVYYSSVPGFKVAVRGSGYFWHTLFYLPEYTNTPLRELKETLHWSEDSSRLYLTFNGVDVWSYDVHQSQ